MATGQGCEHYKRKCQIVAPCCGLYFDCHHCHNAAFEADGEIPHQIDRFAIAEVVCRECSLKQVKSDRCSACDTAFGLYVCLKCAIWEDSQKKKIYHCDKCKLCRVGDRSEYFHCDVCNACLGIGQLNNHHCLADTMKNDCPVCLEPMFDSLDQCIMMDQCGHMIHQSCWRRHELMNPKKASYCLYCRQPRIDAKAPPSEREDSSELIAASQAPSMSWFPDLFAGTTRISNDDDEEADAEDDALSDDSSQSSSSSFESDEDDDIAIGVPFDEVAVEAVADSQQTLGALVTSSEEESNIDSASVDDEDASSVSLDSDDEEFLQDALSEFSVDSEAIDGMPFDEDDWSSCSAPYRRSALSSEEPCSDAS